ncbi:MAG: hypothetical protein ACPG5B_14425 [Chitinophagales bacterium]
MRLSTLLFILSFCIISCNGDQQTQQQEKINTPKKAPNKLVETPKTTTAKTLEEISKYTISIGEGGGLTGAYTMYVILPTGNVQMVETLNNTNKSVKILNQAEQAKIYNELQALNFENIKYNKPSNMTYYVTVQDVGLNHTVRWGNKQKDTPKKVEQFYKNIIKIINTK